MITGANGRLAWLAAFAVAGAAGFVNAWLLIGWHEIGPANLSWLAGDPAEHEVGWEFLRHALVWQFPVTWIDRLDYPWGVSAAYMDVIPLVAVPLRLFSSLLPLDFQYFGLYAVLCCCLQTWYGLKLTSLFAKGDPAVAFIGGAFFLLSPVLTAQFYGHFALMSQWILLAELFYYFSSGGSAPRQLIPFVVLAAVAAAIQPYMALMADGIAIAAIVRASDRPSDTPSISKNRYWKAGSWILLVISVTLLLFLAFGFWIPGKSWFPGTGYTHWSMNLLAPISPHENALYLRPFSVANEDTLAGYDYLGLGILLLLFITIARAPRLLQNLWAPEIRPLTIMAVLFTLLALSLKVTFADRVLLTVPAPKFVLDLLASFRASGRLFWPAYYLLMLGAIAGTIYATPSIWGRRLLLAAALTIQYLDVLAVRNGVAAQAQLVHTNPLISPDWTGLSLTHRHLIIVPAFQCGTTPGGPETWPYFARLAARSGLTLNSVYLPRISPDVKKADCVTLPRQLVQSGLQRDTAYVLSDQLALAVLRQPRRSHYCRRVDRLDLCTYDPAQASRSALLAREITRSNSTKR